MVFSIDDATMMTMTAHCSRHELAWCWQWFLQASPALFLIDTCQNCVDGKHLQRFVKASRMISLLRWWGVDDGLDRLIEDVLTMTMTMMTRRMMMTVCLWSLPLLDIDHLFGLE